MSGKVDRKTASKVGERKRQGKSPEWFTRDLALGDHGDDVAELNRNDLEAADPREHP